MIYGRVNIKAYLFIIYYLGLKNEITPIIITK